MVKSPPKRGDAAKVHRKQQMVRYAVGGAALLALVGLLAFVTTNLEPSVPVEEIAGDVTVEGTALSVFQNPENDMALGQRIPIIETQDFEGNTVRFGDNGRPTMVAFMASWCPACQQELPHIVEWYDQGRDDVDVVVVTTALDRSRPNWPPDRWLTDAGYTGTVARDDADASIAQTYGMSATPFWVAFDSDGDVLFRIAGVMGTDQIDALADLVANSSVEQLVEGPTL